ncbi:VWA domain-containing protein [Psychrobacillus sp. FSL H8-0510]|uniref:VWA domain-containing protein n=1 Tax=Psychrobacillus sp. FSL H8-0510 TaxID=2921394 RepID=UPI0030F4F301
MKKDMPKLKQRVERLVERKNFKRIMEGFVSYMIPARSDVISILTVGGGSYTDGKKVVVGIPEWVWDLSPEEIFLVMRALSIHECQHVNSSSFTGYVAYQEKMKNYFLQKYPKLRSNYVVTASQYVGNGTEDGRIERIAANKRPGTLMPIKFFRGIWWKHQPMSGDSEYGDFLFAIVTLSTMGILPKEWETHWKGTRAEKEIDAIRPLIKKAVLARTSALHLKVCEEIMLAIEPYLVILMEERQEADQQFADMMKDVMQDFTSSSETEENTGSRSTHYDDIEKEDEQEESEDAGQGESGEDQEGEEGEKGNEKGSGSEENDDSEEGEDEKEKSGKGSSDSKNNDEKSDEESSGSETTGQGDEKEGESDKDEEDSKDGTSSDKNKEEEKEGNTNSDEHSKKDAEAKIQEEMEKESDKLFQDANRRMEKAAREAKLEKKQSNEYPLTDQEIKEVVHKAIMGDSNVQGHRNEKMTYRNKMKLTGVLLKEAKKLRRDVETILKNKKSYNLYNQRRGVVDANSIWKVGIKETDVFMKRGHEDQTDYVGYLLWDGSGSMTERLGNSKSKYMSSGEAIAVAEEALRGLIPFKILQFCSNNWSTLHRQIKDFDESSNFNHALTHLSECSPKGGNRDGLAIRVATAELMKRPEKERLLIIFSDGMPTVYASDSVAKKDVNNAVKEARKLGIRVISVFFGSEHMRKQLAPNFKEMYQRNIIFTDDQSLTRHLSRTIKQTIK